MMSLIPPSLVILPLVLIIIYFLNKRHERKIKDSFDELIEPVEQDNLFDLPKANNPTSPAAYDPYVPPSDGDAKLKDDLSKDERLNAVIERAQDELKRPVRTAADKARLVETNAEKLARVQRLQAELARVQAKKRQLKKQQNAVKIRTEARQESLNQDYQSLKPSINVRVKK